MDLAFVNDGAGMWIDGTNIYMSCVHFVELFEAYSIVLVKIRLRSSFLDDAW